MRVLDYLRLGSAGLKMHKKRALIVVIMLGLLFSIIMAGIFILQGIQNIVLGKMLAPTSGKVLLMSSVDIKVCDEDCNIPNEITTIKANIEKYGGQVIPATYSQTNDGIFYHLDKEVFSYQSASTEDDVSEVTMSLYNLNKLTGRETSEHDFSSNLTVAGVNELRDENLYKTVTSKSGKKYYIAGILPGEAGAPSLSLAYVGDSNNPLNLLLEQVVLGGSESFIIKPAKTSIAEVFPDGERPSGIIEQYNIDTETMGLIFAEFPSLDFAYAYYQDKSNYCAEFNRFSGNCGRDYRYQTIAVISDPLTTYENLQEIWKVFGIITIALCIIALIIAISTYVRIIGEGSKVISLYKAMGATNLQVRIIYLIHLTLLSLLAIISAIIIGLGIALVVSFINQENLQAIFTLGFASAPETIRLIGWNDIIWEPILTALLAAFVSMILCNHQFKNRKIARVLK